MLGKSQKNQKTCFLFPKETIQDYLHWQTSYEVQLVPDATSTSADTDKVNFRNVNDHRFLLPQKKLLEQKISSTRHW